VFEVDFIPVGSGGRHGDAIALRFARPGVSQLGHVVIDAGFHENGGAVVAHVKRWYETDAIDLAILTHRDGDHIGGMGAVLRGLRVHTLWLHRLGAHGGASLPAAAAVEELISVAREVGTDVLEPFAGDSVFGGALRILSPSEAWYEQLVREQVMEAKGGRLSSAGRLLEAARRAGRRFLEALPDELPFTDAGGTNPRNNSCIVTLVEVEGTRLLFPADAGVPALEQAWEWVEASGDPRPPEFVQLPHHGSRRNVSSALLNRILGPTGQPQTKTAFVNVAPEAVKHPNARVANAFMRRGYVVGETKGKPICYFEGSPPQRRGWVPLEPLAPMDESGEDL
jgi:beta-lactamase superfamily II metal-dependent hydrolase